MRQLCVVGLMVCLFGSWAAARGQSGTIRVQVTAEGKPADKVEVVVGSQTRQSDAFGAIEVQVPAGDVEVTAVKEGYVATTVKVTVAAGARQDVTIDLQPEPTLEETVTVVATTRTNKRLEDQPIRRPRRWHAARVRSSGDRRCVHRVARNTSIRCGSVRPVRAAGSLCRDGAGCDRSTNPRPPVRRGVRGRPP